MYAKAELAFKDYGLGTNVEETRGKICLLPAPQVKVEGENLCWSSLLIMLTIRKLTSDELAVLWKCGLQNSSGIVIET